MSDLGFALNYTNLHELLLPSGVWARIGAGINSIDPSGNETVAQDAYYDGGGLASTSITGGQVTIAYKGHRIYGDPAQDYIASIAYDYGETRVSRLRWTAPDGSVLVGDCTIASIKTTGGDPNSKSAFEFELQCNGRPTLTPGDASAFPTSINASGVSVEVGGTAQAIAIAEPPSASQTFAFAVENNDIATVSSDGIVTGVAEGETKLSIKSMVKPSVGVEVTVTVVEPTSG